MLKSGSCAQSKSFLKALKFVPCSDTMSGIYLYLHWCYRYSRIWSSVCPSKFDPNQFVCSIYMRFQEKLCLRIGTWDPLPCCARSTRYAQLLYCLLCPHQPCLDLFQSSLSHLLQLPSVISSSSSLMLSTVSIACPSSLNSSCKFLPSSWKQHLLETEGQDCLLFSGCPMDHG